MLLVSAKSGPFKSIDEPQTVEINEKVIVFVGMNEAGKTVFLQSLEKSNDALGVANFNHVEDYPRKDLPSYLKQHKAEPAVATVLTYELTEEEVTAANDELHTNIPFHFQFSVSHKYDNSSTLSFSVDERPVLRYGQELWIRVIKRRLFQFSSLVSAPFVLPSTAHP